MASRARILKIALGTLCGAAAGLLAALVFMAFPASLTRGAPPSIHLAVVVDTGAGLAPSGSGLGSALLGPLTAELRPAPRAAKAFLDSLAPVDLRVYTFDSTATRSAGLLLLQSPPVPRKEGALGQALALAQTDFAKSFGPKLVCIWLDRPFVGQSDIAAARRLKDLGWEVRIYGTSDCDPDTMRSLASDIHFAFREPRPGLSKALKQAMVDVPRREAALKQDFSERPRISAFGRSLVTGALGLFLGLLMSLLQAATVRRLGASFVMAFASALVIGIGAYLLAPIGSNAIWMAIAGAGAGMGLGFAAPNARWWALFLCPALVGVTLGFVPLPLDVVWGPALIGSVLGLSAAVAEEVSRGTYLEVREGARTRLLNLGPREVSFGTSPSCSYVLPEGNARVASVRFGSEGPYRVDSLTGRSRNLHPLKPQRIGRLIVIAHGHWAPAQVISPDGTGRLVLRIGDQTHVLQQGSTFSALQLPVAKGSPDGTVAEVTENPAQPGVMGLTNHSGGDWFTTLPSGEQTSIPPGRTVRLAPGTRISFGSGDGVIEARS